MLKYRKLFFPFSILILFVLSPLFSCGGNEEIPARVESGLDNLYWGDSMEDVKKILSESYKINYENYRLDPSNKQLVISYTGGSFLDLPVTKWEFSFREIQLVKVEIKLEASSGGDNEMFKQSVKRLIAKFDSPLEETDTEVIWRIDHSGSDTPLTKITAVNKGEIIDVIFRNLHLFGN